MINFNEAPICQSCSMPLVKDEDFGTNADAGKNTEYCAYCFQNGKFTEPQLSQEEMIERVTDLMVQSEKGDRLQVRLAVDRRIRSLRRWQ